jgi:hypothetical protein
MRPSIGLLDAVGLEERRALLPQLHALDELGPGAREEGGQALVLLVVVDERALEVGGEDVAHHADREVGLLEDHRRGDGLVGPLLEHLVELVQVQQLALEVLARGALRRRADDRAGAVQVEALDLLAQALTLLVVQALGDADALARRGEDHVAAGDGQLHRQAGALGLQGVLDDLADDLLARLEQVGDLLAALPAAAAPRGLDPGEHDLVDVEEPVLVEPDVDERRLEPGQDVVDLALVDVADDRAHAAALEVDLGDAPVLLGGVVPFHQRDAGLPAVHADEDLLLHRRRPFWVTRACTWIDWRSPTASSVVSTLEPP